MYLTAQRNDTGYWDFTVVDYIPLTEYRTLLNDRTLTELLIVDLEHSRIVEHKKSEAE